MKVGVQILSGILLPAVLILSGAYLGARLLPQMFLRKREVGSRRERGSLRSLGVALAGTLGVGNIAGVASAIAFGGAGAVFWMWISALFAMVLKYAEVVLALRTRRYDVGGTPFGGAPYYIKKAFGRRWGRGLAVLFSLLCLGCAFCLGGVVQSAAAAEAMHEAFRIPPLVIGALLGAAAAVILSRGALWVERVCSALVCVVCLLFFLASVAAILLRAGELPRVMREILSGAFSAQSVGGGVIGFFNSRAIRYGVARGVVSNEAGCGTAPFAHAASPTRDPVAQGFFGVIEVFVDTVILCTVTAFVILCSGTPVAQGGGMRFALLAYSALLGRAATPILALSTLLFAFATVLCWAHYAAHALRFLGKGENALRALPLATLIACVIGAVAAPAILWEITDVLLALMALINISALLMLHGEIEK